MPKPVVNFDRCKKAKNCVAVCPMNVFDWDDEKGPIVARPDDCIGCKACENGCPEKAIEVIDDDKEEQS